MSGSAKHRGHRKRQLGDTPTGQSISNYNPVADAEASDDSDMEDSQFLEQTFRGLSTANSSSLLPGTWTADLAFLISDDIAATTYLESAELGTLNKHFSITTYLSPAGVGQVAPKVILHKGQPIDDALLVCLAMNSECRIKGTAVFYHLPLRQNEEVGHPSDLVFMPKTWTREDKYHWDNAGWPQRLERYGVNEGCSDKIDGSALVVPICSRILRFGEHNSYSHMTATEPYNKISGRPLPNYATDPAVVEDVYRYSRPLQDLSSYLLLYPSIHTPPLTCATGIFEDKAHSDRLPTPNDMSETFVLRVKCGAAELHGKVARTLYDKSRKRYLAAGKPSSTNGDVVECLWRAWHDEALKHRTLEKTENGDKVRYSWQELMNIMDTGFETRALVANWPRT